MSTLGVWLVIGAIVLFIVLVAIAVADHRPSGASAPSPQATKAGSPKHGAAPRNTEDLFVPLRPPKSAASAIAPPSVPTGKAKVTPTQPGGTMPFIGLAAKPVAGKRCFITGNPDRETCGCSSCTQWKKRRKA